jgi:hypothetical protein
MAYFGCPPQKEVSVAAKVCKRCGAQKAAQAFPRNKLTADGLHSYCKCGRSLPPCTVC